ncbi:hypothetical protein BaRGS_00001156 [Batillaria attramentaria]|uniref:Peptidase C1A papain C-terminal domain-containing protein n=1 Tax=Batillaria attramentaria TaxID=370345 RepID=A0ABD0M6D9_9CAEN
MYLELVAVILAVTASCHGNETPQDWLRMMSWESRDNLLHLHSHLDVKKLTAPPVPIYRPDLGNQIAYWLIRYNHNNHAIISAGDHTGDYSVILQGEDPSPVDRLDQQAASTNSTCVRYILLTPSPDLNMACDFAGGRITERPLGNENATALWTNLRHEENADDENEKEMADHKDETAIHLHIISSFQPAAFPVTDMRSTHIRSLGTSNGSDISVRLLCKVLGVCDESGRVHVYRKTEYGEVYVHLEPVNRDGMEEFQHDLHFEVVGTDHENRPKAKGFALEPSHRAKRQSAYTYYSIDDRTLMPDYDQFKSGKCQVGCGPVAWAQIFGYYDRRAHAGRGSASSQALYRCGTDGTTGSNSCQAPRYNDDRMKNYIAKLKDNLRTFCLFGSGATLQKRMDDVEGFYKARQGSSGDIVLKYNKFFVTRLVGVNSDKVRDSALSYIRQKWPVIAGFRVSGVFSQHYAVMTQYRTRTVRKKVCKLLIFCKTRTVREYDMYLHMGWGGSQNGWRSAKMFMAAVAKY